MTRYGLLILALTAPLLDGCGTDMRESPPISPTAEEQALRPDGAHCRAVARERADDAQTNGYGVEIEDAVYQETYQDCMAWHARDKPQ
jgi:hypothetical protein